MPEDIEQMSAQPGDASDNGAQERDYEDEVDLDDAEDDAPPGDTGEESADESEQGVEEEDPYVKQLEETVEKYKESLRAVTRERNEAKARLRAVEGGQEQPQSQGERGPEGELETLAQLLADTSSLEIPTVEGYKDAGAIIHPILKGKPWDENSEMVCLGDVANPKDWYPREQAIKLAAAEAILGKVESIKREQEQAEAQARLEKMAAQLEQAGKDMLKNALPGQFTDGEIPDELMNALRSMAATEMFNRGVTVQRLASDDPEAVNIALDTMKDVVRNIRKIIAVSSRVNETAREDARSKAPIPATGTATVPVEKRTSEMTRAEHRRYLRDLALKKLGLMPREG